MLSVSGCQERIARLRAVMERLRLDAAVLTHPKNVYYFSGFLPHWTARAALVVGPREVVLACGAEPGQTAATQVLRYEATPLGTVRQDQARLLADLVRPVLSGLQSAGTEFTSCDLHLRAELPQKALDLEPEIHLLRRRKDPDELQLIRRAASCLDACYQRAAEVIRPGLSELELYNELRRVCVEAAGEPIGQFGNDFQCGTPGGPPRNRPAQTGELWILDLGAEYRGYFADASRVFSVGGGIDRAQREAWSVLVDALKHAEQAARPGVSASQVYNEVQARLDAHLPGAFFHHLGHGFGLTPHEAPHLSPHWNETFEAGDTFTIEPGLYHPSLRGGARIENDYLLTSDGVENLISAPLDILPAGPGAAG